VKARAAISAVALAAAVALADGVGSGAAADSGCPASNPPDELVLVGGSGQTAQLGRQFQSPFQVGLSASDGCPLTGNLAGVNVDFYAPSSGASGIFASTGTHVAVVGTDAQGVATAPAFTANDTAGSYRIKAESDYGAVELDLTNAAGGLPASIIAVGRMSQQATVGSVYPEPLQARVADANGNPVQGVAVDFVVVPGSTTAGASFLGGAGVATTDSNGVATSPPLLANGSPGRFTAVASVDGASAVATYTLDNHAGSTTVAAISTSDPTARVGTRFRALLRAQVLDAGGLPVEGASVTFAIGQSSTGAGATFVGGDAQATELTDASGVAISPPLLANTTAGSFTATADTAATPDPVGYSLRNLAGAPAAVTAGAASGESTSVGRRFPVPLAVTVTDRYGNPVAGAAVVFRAPASGPSGRFHRRRRLVRAVRVTTNAEGVAVAPPLSANRRAGGYVVTAAAGPKRAAFALVNLAR
jgi:protocatechuate 3,4-dioxygenase beta subunit